MMFYFIRQTLRNLRESWGLFLQTLLMMSVCLLIFGVFGLVGLQVEEVLLHWEGEAPLLVYLDKDLASKKREQLRKELQSLGSVEGVKFISAKEAMERLRRSLSEKKSLLGGLDAPLFPPSFELQLKSFARNPKTIARLSKTIAAFRGVHEVDTGREWVAPLWRIARWMRAIFLIGGGLLLLTTSLMAAGTIRLTFFMHQDEIEIMRLVGATESFIRVPFYLEGLLEGLFAAFLSLTTLYAAFFYVQQHFGAAFLSFTTRSLQFFSWKQCLGFVLVGCFSGIVGSWIALFSSSLKRFKPV